MISAVDEIMSQSEWILDGNYISTIEQRIKGADTIFLFDYTKKDCLEGVKSRIGEKRDDISWIETKLDPDFEKWIVDFRKDTLPEIAKKYEAECVWKMVLCCIRWFYDFEYMERNRWKILLFWC